jgi:hypothetical protein
MENERRREAARGKFMSMKPEAVSLPAEGLVKTSTLTEGQSLPLVFEPSFEGVDLPAWVGANRQLVAGRLGEYGGLLFRGFDVDSADKFDEFVSAFSGRLMGYLDQHTPRTRVSANIYTSTEYPADHHVPFHSENSKNHIWPMRLWFFCLQPAERGGETPIADNRKVFALVDPKLRARFMEKGVMYVRNFGEGVGLSWQTAFQTESRAEVENYFRATGASFDWKDGGDRLRVRHVCQATALHPQTGEAVWFNQAHLFHVSSVEREARESLLSMFKEEDLPSNAYYGDGSLIEASSLDEIRAAFRQSEVVFPWQPNDILMLDNMLVAHGRRPYAGARKILVAMADPMEAAQLNSQTERLQ